MKKIISFIFLIFWISCQQEDKQSSSEEMYALMPRLYDDGGILVEEKDSNVLFSTDYYTEDNIIYVPNRTFLYSYKYIDKSNEEYKVRLTVKIDEYESDFLDWRFSKEKEDSIIKYLKIVPELSNKTSESDYNQTVIRMDYLNEKKEQLGGWEKTGVIENHGNIWIHPFRRHLFKILELNPFPHIKTPIKVGNKWRWDLNVGDFWGDKRWKEWEGLVTLDFNYEIIEKKVISTQMGELECWVINSTGKSRLGTTKLKSYFNFDEGFVKMEYQNIDSSKLIIEKIQVEEDSK